MAGAPESAITSAIMKALRARGAYVVKVHGDMYQVRGVPDTLCCIRGRFVGFEVKQPGGNPTPLQLHNIAEIRQAGGIAEVVESVDEVLRVLDKAFGGVRSQAGAD